MLVKWKTFVVTAFHWKSKTTQSQHPSGSFLAQSLRWTSRLREAEGDSYFNSQISFPLSVLISLRRTQRLIILPDWWTWFGETWQKLSQTQITSCPRINESVLFNSQNLSGKDNDLYKQLHGHSFPGLWTQNKEIHNQLVIKKTGKCCNTFWLNNYLSNFHYFCILFCTM